MTLVPRNGPGPGPQGTGPGEGRPDESLAARLARAESVPSRTIPQVLADAAARDPDGIWIRSDEGTLSFAGALGQVTTAARGLRDAGAGHGDLVMVTARTTPEYLICWLALTALGAVVVSVNPRSAPAELAGLAQQTRPRAGHGRGPGRTGQPGRRGRAAPAGRPGRRGTGW